MRCLSKPEEVLGSVEVHEQLDLSEPVAVLVLDVLHFVPDSAEPTRSPGGSSSIAVRTTSAMISW